MLHLYLQVVLFLRLIKKINKKIYIENIDKRKDEKYQQNIEKLNDMPNEVVKM